MKITIKQLRRLGACEDQVEKFERLFGPSVIVTEDLCVKHAKDFSWSWAAEKLLSAPAWEAYNEVLASAWKAYDEAVASAQEAYDEATAPAWKAYYKAAAPALKAYDEALASAFGRLAEQED